MKKPLSSCAVDIRITERLITMSQDMGGVFSDSNLHNLIGSHHPLTNNRVISKLIRAKILMRWQRGMYTTQKFDLWLLATRLSKKSYVSMDSALALHGMIGTLSDHQVSVVSPSRSRVLLKANYRISIHSIRPGLFFGFTTNNRGVAIATAEKAFLDMLYYHNRGHRFIVDPLTEVNIGMLNIKRLEGHLKHYRNPKFVRFVNGVLDDNRQRQQT